MALWGGNARIPKREPPGKKKCRESESKENVFVRLLLIEVSWC